MTTPRRNSNARKIPTITPRGQFSSERQKSGLQRSAPETKDQKRTEIDSDSTNEFINFLSTSSKTPEEIIAIQDEEIARLRDRIRILESKENTVILIDKDSLDTLKKTLQSEICLRQEMEKENEVLKNELEQLRNVVQDLQEKLSTEGENEKSLKGQIVDLNRAIQKLEDSNNDLKTETIKLSAENIKLRETLSHQASSYEEEMKLERSKTSTEILHISSEEKKINEELKKQLDNQNFVFQREKTSLDKRIVELERKEKGTKQTISDRQAKIFYLENQNSMLQQEVAKKGRLIREKFEKEEEYQNSIEALKKNLRSELSAKEAVQMKNEILRMEVEKLKQIIQEQAENLLHESRKDSEEQIEFLKRCKQELEDENEKLKTETVKLSTQITLLNQTISKQARDFEDETKSIKLNTSSEYLELLTEEKKKNEVLNKQLVDKDFELENFKSNVDMKIAIFEGKEKDLKEQLFERHTKITSLQNQSDLFQQELAQKDRLLREKTAIEEADETSKCLVSEIKNVGDDASVLYQQSTLQKKYSAIFENEWKNALTENKTGKSEQRAIANLLDIIKDAHDFCNKKVLDFTRDLLKTFEPFKIGANTLPPDISKVMYDYKKSIAIHLVGSLQKIFINDTYFVGPETEKYKRKCIEVCWLMKIHDPPIVIDAKIPHGRFDGNKYQTYTKSGKEYKFLVWPAAYLHRGGPVLCKGTAEVE